jgi:hypothetical protein
MNDEKPSSLITSYHYLRYILLGFFLFMTYKFIELCSMSKTAKILFTLLYAIIGITLLVADIRNYILYKLLYHKFYECSSKKRKKLTSNVSILSSMLERRGINGELGNLFNKIEELDEILRENPQGPLKYLRKLRFNWLMFWAVQPGPVSVCIIFLYITSIVLVSICSFTFTH